MEQQKDHLDGEVNNSNRQPTRSYFPFMYSFYDAIQELTDADKLTMFDAIMRFAFFEQEPQMESPFAKLCWKLIRPMLENSQKKYMASKQGGAPKGNQNARKTTEKQPQNNQKTTIIQPQNNQKTTIIQPQNNHQESINKNININRNINRNNDIIKENIIKEKGTTLFRAPTLEEIVAYCNEKGYEMSVASFLDYYTSNGWMVGRNKMKDWRAAVRNWVRRDKERNDNNKPQANGFDAERQQRDAEFAELINDIANS